MSEEDNNEMKEDAMDDKEEQKGVKRKIESATYVRKGGENRKNKWKEEEAIPRKRNKGILRITRKRRVRRKRK